MRTFLMVCVAMSFALVACDKDKGAADNAGQESEKEQAKKAEKKAIEGAKKNCDCMKLRGDVNKMKRCFQEANNKVKAALEGLSAEKKLVIMKKVKSVADNCLKM